jgi:membrane-associated phospholipid phosphatase
VLWLLGIASLLASTFYPTDIAGYVRQEGISRAPWIAHFTERYVRFINPGLQVAVPLLLRDKAGLVQLVKVAIVTTLATQVMKHALNNVHFMGARLGERPTQYPGKPPRDFADSNFNMPSGHSSMASCGAYFVARRYGWKWALIMFPVLLLTMFARVSLDEHTLSAVLGLLISAIFTTPRRKPASVRTES